MSVQICFNFDRQSLEVMKFYSEVFNTPYEAMFVSEDSTQVLHGSMTLLGTHVSFSDIPEGYNLVIGNHITLSINTCLLYTSPSPRDRQKSRMPSSA